MKNVSRTMALAAVTSLLVFPGSAFAGYKDSSYSRDITREDLVDFVDELEFLNEAGRYTAVSGDVSEFDGWSTRYFVDDFGRPTGQRYVVSLVDNGQFNNRVISDAELTSRVIFEPITKDDWFMQLFLYKYNRSQVLGTAGDVLYDVSVLGKNGITHNCQAELSYNGDRIQFSYMDSNEIMKMISAGNPVSIVLTNANDRLESFSLTIEDNAGFDDACCEALADFGMSDVGASMSKDRMADGASYADGVYVGTGIGLGGPLSATVTITDGKISDIVIGDNNELKVFVLDNDNYLDDVTKAFEQIPAAIIEANGVDGVDVIDGAEGTSQAILTAVSNALANAHDASAASDSPAFGHSTSKDGLASPDQESDGDSRDQYRLPDAIADTDAAVWSREYHASSGRSSSASEDVAYEDGEYEGSARGAESDIQVSITIENGRITDVRADGKETRGVGSRALDQLPDAIVEANGTDGVDVVTGATVTSKAVFAAVNDALDARTIVSVPNVSGWGSSAASSAITNAGLVANVSSSVVTTTNPDLDGTVASVSPSEGSAVTAGSVVTVALYAYVVSKYDGSYADGQYTGSAKGMESTVEVTVTVSGGKIVDVKADGQETEGIGSKALERLPGKIVAANGTDGVDAVSGASVTSKAIFMAVEQALACARKDA